MFFITGDTHIPIDINKLSNKYFAVQNSLSKKDYVIICGDFGGVWDQSNEEKYWLDWLVDRNFTTLFIDGNHENFELLKAYEIQNWNGGKVHFIRGSIIHLMRGQIYEIEGTKIFTMGGANSFDKFARTQHKTWWPEEMPNNAEYEAAFCNLEKHNNTVDYIFSHAAPESIMTAIHPDHKDERSLNVFLEKIKNKVEYRKWFMGHLHIDKDWDEKHILLYDRIVDLESNIYSTKPARLF